jgi:hypothetical protein
VTAILGVTVPDAALPAGRIPEGLQAAADQLGLGSTTCTGPSKPGQPDG